METEKYCLCIEDLIYLLTTTLRMNNVSANRFTYRELNEYGKALTEFGKEKGVYFYTALSRDMTSRFLCDKRFILKEDTVYIGFHGIKFTKRLTNEELREELCGYFPVHVLSVIYDDIFMKNIVKKYKVEHGITKTEEEPKYKNRNAALNYGDLFCCMTYNLWHDFYVDEVSFEECKEYGEMLQKYGKQERIDITLNLSQKDTTRYISENPSDVKLIAEPKPGLKFKRIILRSDFENRFLVYIPYYVKDLITDPRFALKVINMYKHSHNIDGRQRTRN